MVLTREVNVLVTPQAKIRHLALKPDRPTIAWVEGLKQVLVGDMDGDQRCEATLLIDHPHRINLLQFHQGHLMVGDELTGLTVYGLDGNVVQMYEVDGGLQCLEPHQNGFVGISGMGHLVALNSDGSVDDLTATIELEDCLHLVTHEPRVFVANQSGDVVAVSNREVVWKRPSRGEIGERITGLGVTRDGGLFLTREGHALVGGEEEAIEFEFWKNDVLLKRQDLRMRMLTSCTSRQGAIVGCDDGNVFMLDEQGDLEPLMSTNHPIFCCLEHEGHVLAASWFYIHGTNGEGLWKVEHQGMPSQMFVDRQHGRVVFAGDDQNDYTSPEPIGIIDLNQQALELDDAELSLWFDVATSNPPPTAEALYADADDVLEHLTADERASYTGQTIVHDAPDRLLAAMAASGEPSVPQEDIAVEADTEHLMEALQGVAELTMEQTDDLLDALQAEVEDVHRPQAVAGEDQRVFADDSDTAIVHLDGRGTHDPHGLVVRSSWHNERGEELVANLQLKLKLPLGLHRFELRVVDRDGSWTTDSLSVEVVSTSTS